MAIDANAPIHRTNPCKEEFNVFAGTNTMVPRYLPTYSLLLTPSKKRTDRAIEFKEDQGTKRIRPGTLDPFSSLLSQTLLQGESLGPSIIIIQRPGSKA